MAPKIDLENQMFQIFKVSHIEVRSTDLSWVSVLQWSEAMDFLQTFFLVIFFICHTRKCTKKTCRPVFTRFSNIENDSALLHRLIIKQIPIQNISS